MNIYGGEGFKKKKKKVVLKAGSSMVRGSFSRKFMTKKILEKVVTVACYPRFHCTKQRGVRRGLLYAVMQTGILRKFGTKISSTS